MQVLRFIILLLLLSRIAPTQTPESEHIFDLTLYGFKATSSSDTPTFLFISSDVMAVNLPTSSAKLIFYSLKSGIATERSNSADIAPFLPTRDGRFIRFVSHTLVLNDAELREIAHLEAPFAQRFGARSVRVSPGGQVVALPRDRDIMLLNAANFDLIDLLPSSELLSIGDHAALMSPADGHPAILLKLFGTEPVLLLSESRICQLKAEFLDDDHILITPCGKERRRVVDLAGRMLYTLEGTDVLAFIQPSRNGKRFALEIRTLSKGKVITGSIRHAALTFDQVIHRVYDTATGKLVMEVRLKQECGACLMYPYSTLSPDGTHLAVLDEGRIAIYEIH